MKALIVAGGEKLASHLLMEEADKADFIIGADKGCQYLLEEGIYPKYIVGDFDSSSDDTINKLVANGAEKHQYNCEKDFTDSDIALELAIELGAKEIVIASVTGTRLDHSFANFGLLKKAAAKGIKAIIINDTNKIYLANKNTTVYQDLNYKYISFLAYCDIVKNLSIYGAKYTLINYDLEIGDNRTVSNEFAEESIDISFDTGSVLVIHSRD